MLKSCTYCGRIHDKKYICPQKKEALKKRQVKKMSKNRIENTPSVEENPLFHNTWKLLKNYRDAVWNLELAVQQVRNTF